MLDMQVFREEVDKIRADHDRRGLPHDSIDKVLALDSEWKLMLCLLYTSPSPRDREKSRMPSSA